MIYQIYYHADQKKYCFNQPPYRTITTKPETEPLPLLDDIRIISLLREAWVRQQLCEYSVMTYHWRCRSSETDWVGFTSWRQLFKGYTYVMNLENTQSQPKNNIIIWGRRELNSTLGVQAEENHPGIIEATTVLLRDVHQQSIPKEFFSTKTGAFCSYWAASTKLFFEYMEWSYPLIREAIVRWGNDPPFNRHDGDPQLTGRNRSLAFLQERLFNIWAINTNQVFDDRTCTI